MYSRPTAKFFFQVQTSGSISDFSSVKFNNCVLLIHHIFQNSILIRLVCSFLKRSYKISFNFEKMKWNPNEMRVNRLIFTNLSTGCANPKVTIISSFYNIYRLLLNFDFKSVEHSKLNTYIEIQFPKFIMISLGVFVPDQINFN